jgi:hypothetical protein
MTTRIKLRRDTAANWTTNDPVLALGEAGYDTTNNQLRVGDGTTVWSGLESIGGTGNKITAEKTYSDNFNDGSEHTFAYTTGSIAVQMGDNIGLYLDDLLSRWVEYFDGNLAFPYNYSNINLVINPNTDDLASTVTNVISSGNPPLYTITLATAHPEPITIDDIDFNYNYINTIGLDIVNGVGESNSYFGMATGDDDITIRSGRDITLDAADDVYISGGNEFQLTLVNQADMPANSGIEITTETTSTDYTWTFRFDGSLELPEGLTLPTKSNMGYDVTTTLSGPTLQLSNDSENQVIVTGPTATENNTNAQRIVIQGQRGYGSTSTTGEGGDVYIWGGVGGDTNGNTEGWGQGGGSGGDVKLRGGEGLNDTGGYVRIEGGNVAHFNTSTTGNPGFVEITGGDVTVENAAGSSYGGDVRITGGRAYTETTQSGVVQVITGGYTNGDVLGGNTWEFGNDGTLTVPGDILDSEGVSVYIDTADSQWIVDPTNTGTYTADGSLHKPFKNIASALAYIEARIADTSLVIDINGSIVDNPQFIFLKSSITENVALTRGNIFICGETPDAGHVPIWIEGHVTITPANTGTNAINVNRFGLFNIAVRTDDTYHSIELTGSNPAKLYLNDVYCYQGNATKSCVYADNTGTGSRVEMNDCTMARAGGSVYLIDIQRGFCSINNLETNGTGQVLNQANDSLGTMLRSSLDANTGSVITLSGSVQWGMGEVILNNTGAGSDTHGITMSGSASMQFGVCTFNIPVGDGSNRAINGTGTNTVLYADPIFQYGSTNKISTAITLVPLTKTFTAV